MKIRPLLFASLLFNTHFIFAQITWVQKANVGNQTRSSAAGFSLNSYGYVGTGDNQFFNNLGDFWQYDPATDSWNQKSNFGGTIRKGCVGLSIGNYGYIGLGWDNSSHYSDFWQYDPALNSWTQKATFPGTARSGGVSLAVDSFGYTGLGWAGGNTYLNDFWKYDPVANTWTVQTPYPGPATVDGIAFNIGDTGYVGIGYNNYGTANYYDDFWAFFPGGLRANFTPSDTTFCGEGPRCIDFIDHSGGNPTSWQWIFTGAVPDTSSLQNPTNICYNNAGIYPVTLIVTNNLGTDTLVISPMVTYSAGPNAPNITMQGDTLISSYADQYQWYLNGFPIAGATDSAFIATSAGTYAVRISDSLGCSKISGGVFMTSIETSSVYPSLNIFPNPTSDYFSLSLNRRSKEGTVFIYDAFGKEMYSDRIFSANQIFHFDLPPGIYVVEVRLKDGWSTKEKLMVK